MVIDKRVKITDKYLRLFFLIVFGSIPAGIAGYFLKGMVEKSFSSIGAVGIFLLLTGVVLLLTRLAQNRSVEVNWWRSFVIGIFQAVAIFPGLSRSGLTISGGLFAGLDPVDAFDFSFLLSLPVMIGANIVEFKKLSSSPDLLLILVGVIISFVIGMLALVVLRKTLIRKSFYLFSIYCFVLGILILAFRL